LEGQDRYIHQVVDQGASWFWDTLAAALTVFLVSCPNHVSLEQVVHRLPMDSRVSGCLDCTGVAVPEAELVVDQEVQVVDRNCSRDVQGKSEVDLVVCQEVPAVLAEAATAEVTVVALAVV